MSTSLAPTQHSIEDLRIEALRLAMNSGAVNETQTVKIAATYLDFLTGKSDQL